MNPDALVIGAGPNGLFAACRLARAGRRVLLLEARDRPGGALWDEPRTEPGFKHDVGAGFITFRDSEAFRALDLESRGLRWALGAVESAHPALDGTCPVISRDIDRSIASFGTDGRAWRRLQRFHARIAPRLLEFLAPFPRVGSALRMNRLDGLRLAFYFAHSSGGLSRTLFRTQAARRVIPAMGLHVDIGPFDIFGAPIAYVLAMRASTGGYAVPVGGASVITKLLVEDLVAHGGSLQLSSPVARIRVREGASVGVTLENGDEIDVDGPIVANTSAPALYLHLLGKEHIPPRIVSMMHRFPMGWGTFKVDYSLDGPVPWEAEACRDAAVVHIGESNDDLHRFTQTVRKGLLPEQPYLVVGQHTLVDPSRAPSGKHTLYVYTHAPSHLDPIRYPGGWPTWRERLADVVTNRIEWLAPGFTRLVRKRRIADPEDLERMDANLIGGDLGGGSNQWWRQLVFRPVFPWFRYATPVDRVYLGSSYTHPGAGVHGMCGWNAAGIALEDHA